MHLWKRLEKMLLDEGYSVSWQQGRSNLYEYMDWLNSCRLIISSDSLGLHLAFALNRKTIGLFGPTDPKEVFFYGGSKIVTTDQHCPQNPCYCNRCATELFCMEKISLKKIMTAVHEQLAKPTAGKNKIIHIQNSWNNPEQPSNGDRKIVEKKHQLTNR
jgi:heptosyltransferase-2